MSQPNFLNPTSRPTPLPTTARVLKIIPAYKSRRHARHRHCYPTHNKSMLTFQSTPRTIQDPATTRVLFLIPAQKIADTLDTEHSSRALTRVEKNLPAKRGKRLHFPHHKRSLSDTGRKKSTLKKGKTPLPIPQTPTLRCG